MDQENKTNPAMSTVGQLSDTNPGPDLAPAIIAALIAASTTALTTTVGVLQQTFAGDPHGKDPVTCIFQNDTPVNFQVWQGTGQTVHGSLLQAPSAIVNSLSSALNSSSDLKEENNGPSYEAENNTWWFVKSANEGSEIVIVYQTKAVDSPFQPQPQAPVVVMYVRNPLDGTNVTAAVLLDDYNDFQDKVNKWGGISGKMEWLIDLITNPDNSSAQCKCTSGGAAQVTLGDFTMYFQPAVEETMFHLTYYNWANSGSNQ